MCNFLSLDHPDWLSSSSHGGVTALCQLFKWRHLPDQKNWARAISWIFIIQTDYRHHHMVAPLICSNSSCGAIFRTKKLEHVQFLESWSSRLVMIIITWWRHWAVPVLHVKIEHVQFLTSWSFRLIIVIITCWRHCAVPVLQVPPSSGLRKLLACPISWVLIIQIGYRHHHMVAPLSCVSSSSGAIFRTTFF